MRGRVRTARFSTAPNSFLTGWGGRYTHPSSWYTAPQTYRPLPLEGTRDQAYSPPPPHRRDLACNPPSPPTFEQTDWQQTPVKALPSRNYSCGWILYSRGRVWVHHLSLSSGHRQNGILRWPAMAEWTILQWLWELWVNWFQCFNWTRGSD